MSNETCQLLYTAEKRSIAYVKRYHKNPKSSQGVMFLGGFRSDMTGTKASFLEKWCYAKNYNFLKFDYSGHGQSSEPFEAGCISDWTTDACAVMDSLTEGPQILVGSSMGGWISILLGQRRSNRVSAFVGIAAAPDFTENSMWANLGTKERHDLSSLGKINLINDYSTEPYTITKKLIEDGRSNLIMASRIEVPYPVRLLQGMSDEDVHYTNAINLANHIGQNDVKVTLVKNADHQFSSPKCLDILVAAIQEFL